MSPMLSASSLSDLRHLFKSEDLKKINFHLQKDLARFKKLSMRKESESAKTEQLRKQGFHLQVLVLEKKKDGESREAHKVLYFVYN